MPRTTTLLATILAAATATCLAPSPAKAQIQICPAGGCGSNKTTTTLTTANVDETFVITASTTSASYRTELRGRIGAGPTLFDETFAASFGDPTVSAAVQSIEAMITAGAGSPITFAAPALASSSQTTSTTRSVRDETTQMSYTGYRITNGPATLGNVTFLPGAATPTYGSLTCTGIAQSTGLVLAAIGGGTTLQGTQPTGCAGGGPLVVATGDSNVDTIVTTVRSGSVRRTTNVDTLMSQTYDIVGMLPGDAMPPPAQTAIPEPASLALAAGFLALLAPRLRAFRG